MKKRNTHFVFALIALIAIPAAITIYLRDAVAKPQTYLTSNEPGALYIRDLLGTIQTADAITITEHSSLIEYIRPELNEKDYREKVYQTVTLTPEQRARFVEIIRGLDPKTQDYATGCIPEPHHRIQFFRKGVLSDSMDICFVCGQIDWHGSSAASPMSIYGGLEQIVAEVGLHPHADWDKKFRGIAEQ